MPFRNFNNIIIKKEFQKQEGLRENPEKNA